MEVGNIDSCLDEYVCLDNNTKNVTIKPSPTNGMGLFICENVRTGSVIIEYKGEILNGKERIIRENYCKEIGKLGDYIIQIGDCDRYIDDSVVSGNVCKFANNSCHPNAEMKVDSFVENCTVLWQAVFLYALADIAAGKEITFDYEWKVSKEEVLYICEYGSFNCRGMIEKYFE